MDIFILAVLNGDATFADSEDIIIANKICGSGYSARNSDYIALFVVGDNVIAVAIVIDENIFAVAAVQVIIALAANERIIAVARVNCIFARAAIDIVVFFGTNDSVSFSIARNGEVVSNR